MSERTKFRLRIFFGILCVFIVERLWTLLTHREESRVRLQEVHFYVKI